MRPNPFRSTREAHGRETAEDYVELISNLIQESGEARTVDLANALAISSVTVTKTLKRLQKEGLISSQPYRSIFLTEAGHAMAKSCQERHKLVHDFLLAIGVDEATAETDAEGIEHHVSQSTLQSMQNFLERQAKP